MISRFLPIRTGDTVLNYYALPLVGVDRSYFGRNYITTKVNREGTVVFCQLMKDTYPDEDFPDKLVYDGDFYLFYAIPEKFLDDMSLIIAGKYSKLSQHAKDTIIEASGLQYRKRRGNRIYTSKLLFALNRDKALIDYFFTALKSSDKTTDPKLYEALHKVELAEKVADDDFI